MDDLKLYEEDHEGLEAAISSMVENVSGANRMSLGLGKCAVAHVEVGRAVRGGTVALSTVEVIDIIPLPWSHKSSCQTPDK